MEVEYKRKGGEALTMGPFASGMQVEVLLQPKAAEATGNRATHKNPLQASSFKRCTAATKQKKVVIVVDAATKAVPLLQLMAMAQKGAEVLVDEEVQPRQPPYIPGDPTCRRDWTHLN